MIQPTAEKFFIVRKQIVLLDYDLADFFGVKTKRLNQAVKRNKNLFPETHMFRMTREEMYVWRFCETATKPPSYKNKRPVAYRPYAFTKAGLAALSLLLHEPRKSKTSIPILLGLPGFLLRDCLS